MIREKNTFKCLSFICYQPICWFSSPPVEGARQTLSVWVRMSHKWFICCKGEMSCCCLCKHHMPKHIPAHMITRCCKHGQSWAQVIPQLWWQKITISVLQYSFLKFWILHCRITSFTCTARLYHRNMLCYSSSYFSEGIIFCYSYRYSAKKIIHWRKKN